MKKGNKVRTEHIPDKGCDHDWQPLGDDRQYCTKCQAVRVFRC